MENIRSLEKYLGDIQILCRTARQSLEYQPSIPIIRGVISDAYSVAQGIHQYWNDLKFAKLRLKLYAQGILTPSQEGILSNLTKSMESLQNKITIKKEDESERKEEVLGLVKNIESLLGKLESKKAA